MKSILIVSNMYPSKNFPSYGIFVKRFCEQLELINVNYNLSVMKKSNGKIKKMISYIHFFLKSFISYFKKENKLIYIHYASHSSIPVLMAHKFLKKKIYVNVHGSDVVPENKKQEKFQKYTIKILSIADKIIVPSEYFKNLVSSKYDISSDKIFIYPSAGINPKQFRKLNIEKNQLLKKFNLKNDISTFGYVGRISEKKGWDVFLRAYAELRKKRNDFQVVIVGDGPEKNKMIQLINELELNDVVLLPLLDQDSLCYLYNSLDCFVFPTMREGESLGLVGLESMACCCPIISSDFAAPKYYVNDKNGLKFEKGNYLDLVDKMNLFLNLSNEEKLIMGKEAFKTSLNYNVESIIEKLKDIVGDNNERIS